MTAQNHRVSAYDRLVRGFDATDSSLTGVVTTTIDPVTTDTIGITTDTNVITCFELSLIRLAVSARKHPPLVRRLAGVVRALDIDFTDCAQRIGVSTDW